MMEIELDIECPFCGESFGTVIDPSAEEQSYIEDCYVCCRPIQFRVRCRHGELESIETSRD